MLVNDGRVSGLRTGGAGDGIVSLIEGKICGLRWVDTLVLPLVRSER